MCPVPLAALLQLVGLLRVDAGFFKQTLVEQNAKPRLVGCGGTCAIDLAVDGVIVNDLLIPEACVGQVEVLQRGQVIQEPLRRHGDQRAVVGIAVENSAVGVVCKETVDQDFVVVAHVLQTDLAVSEVHLRFQLVVIVRDHLIPCGLRFRFFVFRSGPPVAEDELEAIQIGKRILRRLCHIRRGLRRLAAVRLGRVLTRAGRERDEHDRCQKQHDEAFVKTFHVEFLFLLILFDTALRL